MPTKIATAPSGEGVTFRDVARQANAGHRSTPDVIAAVLREAVISGVLAGGTQLRQSEVAADFGVSVIPVREALQQLAAEGFVVLQRNRGAIVTKVSVEEIEELFDLRVAVETILMAAAMPNTQPADIDKAVECQRALEAETEVDQWGRWNWLFHEALYLPARRPRTLAIASNINKHIDRYLRLQMVLLDGIRRSRREHGAILTACRRGDAERAVSLLRQHIRGVEKIILNFAVKQTGSQ